MLGSLRVKRPHITQHIIQPGNNRQPCFALEQGFTTYLNYLQGYSKQSNLDVSV